MYKFLFITIFMLFFERANSQIIHSSSLSPELSNNLASKKIKIVGEINQFGLFGANKTMVNGIIKWGFVNEIGEEIIPIIFDAISDFDKNGLVIVTEKLKICFDLSSEKCQADVIYDSKGNVVFGKPNQMIRFRLTDSILNNNLIVIKSILSFEKNEGEVGYNFIEKSSLKTIHPDLITYFKVVGKNEILVKSHNRAWTMDFSGKEVFNLKFNDIICVSEGVYGVKHQNNKFGFVDRKGKILASFDYSSISPFIFGLSIVEKGENKVGIITKYNAQIAPCTFKSIEIKDNFYYLTDENGQNFTLDQNGNCNTNCDRFNKLLKKENMKK